MTTRRLAVDGGAPAFEAPRRTGAPNEIDRARVYALLDEMFDRSRLTNNGPLVRRLEERIAELLDVPHVVNVANGTLALLIAATGLGARGGVAVPSWTFAGTVQPLVWAGLEPCFVEVDAESHSMDPDHLKVTLERGDVGLVVPVHLWGRPCHIDRIEAAAAAAGTPVLYDAAHAFGASHDGTPIGNFGDAEIFSFHATKWMTSIEGGAVTTANGDLAAHLRRLRNFGFAGEDDIPVNGINAKMSEMHAAVGLCQLDRFDQLRAINRDRYVTYRSCFEGSPDLRLLSTQVSHRDTAPHSYVVIELDPSLGPFAARDLQRILEAENVHVRRYFSPGVHRLEAFARFAPAEPLPVTDSLAGRCIALPTGEGVSREDVVTISGLVSAALDRIKDRSASELVVEGAGAWD